MDIDWRKSSFSEQPDGDCVELSSRDGGVFVRESDDPGVVIGTTPQKLRVFLARAKAGVFDAI